MTVNNIELLSIDLSNYCSKECPFCYNHSTKEGNMLWQTDEVINFAKDCVENGVKAISLGGGEPMEYDGVFSVIEALEPIVYLSVTSNGLPLLKPEIREKLLFFSPDKIHITVHNPDITDEVDRIEKQILWLQTTKIKPGINLLVSNKKIESCKMAYSRFIKFLNPDQIILVPQRFSCTPTPKELATITGGKPFQSPSCLLKCQRPTNFCSVSWDKKVNSCSFAQGKQPLVSLDYKGALESLNKVNFQSCESKIAIP
jgi:MoaA/NifB/PqqE/SkfB family radical SAM enzyme